MPGLIAPIAIAPETPLAAGKKPAVGAADFVSHVRRAMIESDRGNKLGGEDGQDDIKPAEALKKIAGIEDPAEAMAAFLSLLKKLAAADAAPAGGGWLAAPTLEQVTNLAAAAGLNGKEISKLTSLFDQQGTASMAQVLDLFISHFSDLARGHSVSLPETDLPILNGFLEKMALDPADIAALEEVSLQDGKVDLAAFTDKIKELAGKGKDAAFSFWEIRDLSDLMARAGWKADKQPPIGNVLPDGENIGLGLDELVNLLHQAVENGAIAKKGPDMPAFVAALKGFLGKCGFSSPDWAFTPVVEKSRKDALEDLLQTVDLSKVRMKKVPAPEAVKINYKSAAPSAEGGKSNGTEDAAPATSALKADLEKYPVFVVERPGGKGAGRDIAAARDHQGPPAFNITAQPLPVQPQAVEIASARPPLPVDPAQVLEQLTASVFKGITDQQHHIKIRLQPPELGEVKVDLVVKHDQVAVSFAMENSQVKKILESNLQQFRDQLAGRGFTLAGLDVSVGGGDEDPSEKWREAFARPADWGGKVLPPGGLSEVMAPYLPARLGSVEQGINLMV